MLGWVLEGREVAFRKTQLASAEQAAHNLAAAGTRQIGAESDLLGCDGRAESFSRVTQ
jgi:hypothetical protein